MYLSCTRVNKSVVVVVVVVVVGQFVPREPKLVRGIGSFEKSRVRGIGGKFVELE